MDPCLLRIMLPAELKFNKHLSKRDDFLSQKFTTKGGLTMFEQIVEFIKELLGLPVKEVNAFETYAFGKYPQTANGEPQSIEWYILERDHNNQRTLLLSKYLLDNGVFDTPTIPVGKDCDCDVFSTDTSDRTAIWNSSTIRSWLNGYEPRFNSFSKDFTHDNFIQKAFTKQEQDLILPVDTTIEDGPKARCEDRIFFLSMEEAAKYFPNRRSRIGRATPYAEQQRVNIEHGAAWWWLRSPGQDVTRTVCVDPNGNIFPMGSVTGLGQVGIRPAIWLKGIVGNKPSQTMNAE